MKTKPSCTNYKLSEELSASSTMIVATVVELRKRRTNTHQSLACELNIRIGVDFGSLLQNKTATFNRR